LRTDSKSFERDFMLSVVNLMPVAGMPLWHQQLPARDHFKLSTHSQRGSPDVGKGPILRSFNLPLLGGSLEPALKATVVDIVDKESSGAQSSSSPEMYGSGGGNISQQCVLPKNEYRAGVFLPTVNLDRVVY
jgi:hypothetical protein